MRASHKLAAILCAIIALFLLAVARPNAQQGEAVPLKLEARLPLGDVKGRIDHMAVDIARQRLFVAELGNDSVGVIDLKTRTLLRRLTGFKEPQGIGFLADRVYVATARDGSVEVFEGED